MQISAELRWFWRAESLPAELRSWYFDAFSQIPAGGGGVREDVYLADGAQTALGLKLRGGKPGVDIKGLIEAIDAAPSGPFAGVPIEVWGKWTSRALTLEGLPKIVTRKRRWLRKYSADAQLTEIPLGADEQPTERSILLPARGCNVEFTEIAALDSQWCSFGFEAFGSIATVAGDLSDVARLAAQRGAPGLQPAAGASYPGWLATMMTRPHG